MATDRIQKKSIASNHILKPKEQHILHSTDCELINKIKRFCCNILDKLTSHKINKQKTPVSKNITSPVSVANKDTIPNPQLELDACSSIIFNKKTNEYVYITKAPPIENLVISGGGAKGVILLGVLEAFEVKETDDTPSFKEQLKNIAGSSIGAITAGLMASGISAENMIRASEKINFKDLLGKGKGPVHKSGQPLLDFIRENMKNTISGHLKAMFQVDNLNTINSNLIEMFVKDKLKSKIYSDEDIKGHINNIHKILSTLNMDDLNTCCITFSMLHTLHQLDPNIFKDLTITATCQELGETFYFDAEKTPDLDIAIACRASASLPVILNPVKIERQALCPYYSDKVKGDFLTFVDGGYIDNIPVSAMEDKQGSPRSNPSNRGENGQNLQTLALVFDESGRDENEQSPFLDVKIKRPLYNSKNLLNRLIRDTLAKSLAGISTKERNTLKKEEGLELIRQNYTQRNIPLLVSLKTGNFDKAKKLESEYRIKGFNQALEYLEIIKMN